MIQVVIIGYGNVGSHLAKAFQEASEVEVIQLYSRKHISPNTDPKIDVVQDLSAIKNATVYVVAVPDDVIAEVTAQLPSHNALVVHTSGGAAMNAIDSKHRRGVFYPLQSFSKNTNVAYKNVPICIEAENDQDLDILNTLGHSISEKVVPITSEDRAKLHLAAVFVNNFVNHLYSVSEDLLTAQQLDFDLLKPLILETAQKVQTMAPSEAQTGPALRKDKKTIKKHVALLKDESLQELYAYFTKAIQQKTNHS